MADNPLKKKRKATIPNVYYVWVVLAFAAVIAVLYAVEISKKSELIEAETTTKAPSAMISAAEYAKQDLKLGMSRNDVIRRMGKPDWAIIPGDKKPLSLPDATFGLELRWHNPACRNVVVMFSPPPYRVIGWDSGATYCSRRAKENYDALSCALPDRNHLCKP